ncbi:MAG: hypothetical protein CNF02_02175 [OM182 bacterium MED-G28]|uniref:DUF1857 domain-containing protein n=1 Tax=OM182 bacterium MED-G28 TaxID=1986256 RepID=A0A2A5WEX5_9GAMM|nr:MAG: hypothetical protein CNF02_02175 [OM182 bacterium MED-G28]
MTPITRSQLWQGLVLCARSPEKFTHGLQCDSDELINNKFKRIIKAGQTSFCEQVVLYPEQKIFTKTAGNLDQISAQSTASIEEPDTGALFVRFRYKRELDNSDNHVDFGAPIKAAYVQLDRDAVALIRMLAESELSNQSIN